MGHIRRRIFLPDWVITTAWPHLGAILSIITSSQRSARDYRAKLARFTSLSHLTIELSHKSLLSEDMQRRKQLEDVNTKLKNLVADLSLDKAILQDVLR